MSTVEGKKQEKRRALLDAAYELFLERGTAKTSVEDITSRAKVGKGTFYLYFQDKGAVMQALLGRVSYQLLSDACLAVEHFCIFHSSSFSCDSGHNMCIIDQSCSMKPVDCLICLCQIMIFFHKFQHIIQSALDSKIQMLYLFSSKHFQLFLAFM